MELFIHIGLCLAIERPNILMQSSYCGRRSEQDEYDGKEANGWWWWCKVGKDKSFGGHDRRDRLGGPRFLWRLKCNRVTISILRPNWCPRRTVLGCGPKHGPKSCKLAFIFKSPANQGQEGGILFSWISQPTNKVIVHRCRLTFISKPEVSNISNLSYISL